MDDRFQPTLLVPHLAQTIFTEGVRYFPSIDSTNTAAMKAAANGIPAGMVFIADEQTAGRGRGGHEWHSPPGTGLYLSVIVKPKVAAQHVLWLSLAAGLAAQEAIRMSCSVENDLRWPNDILLGTKKLGGILTEMSTEPGGVTVKHAVIGVGINVGQDAFPPELSALATSLRIETGRLWPRVELAAALLQSLSREVEALERGVAAGGASLIRRFEEQSSYARNMRVQVDEEGGYTGITAGLDERGFLRVKTESGVRTVLSGGVRKI